MHLLFDLDGTLTDSKLGIVASMRHALRAVSVEAPPDDDLARLIGPPTYDAFAQLLGTMDRPTLERAVQAYRDRYATVGMFESRVYPGVADGLETLRAAGLGLCVVTSKPHVYARRIIEHFGLRGFFREVYGSELSGLGGDKGVLIAQVLVAEGALAHETWMIGDRSHDVVGAKKNGLRAAGVLWGYGTRDELVDAGADVLYASMPELVRSFTSRPA
jgi:phosphoglycolate phosphatase